MEVHGLAMGVRACRTTRAIDGLRREILRPVEGQQQRAVQRAERVHYPGLCQGVEQKGVQRRERHRRCGIKQAAEVVVRWHLRTPNSVRALL